MHEAHERAWPVARGRPQRKQEPVDVEIRERPARHICQSAGLLTPALVLINNSPQQVGAGCRVSFLAPCEFYIQGHVSPHGAARASRRRQSAMRQPWFAAVSPPFRPRASQASFSPGSWRTAAAGPPMETSMSLSFPELPQLPEAPNQQAPPRSRFLTVFEVAEIVGCHAETVRRAYSCGQLTRRRFGVRGCRFTLADVEDWMSRGAPTRSERREGGAGRLVRLACAE